MYKSYGTCRELMELRNLTSVGELILMSALQRRASVGGHFCLDDPPHVSSISVLLPVPAVLTGVACATIYHIYWDCQICLLYYLRSSPRSAEGRATCRLLPRVWLI